MIKGLFLFSNNMEDAEAFATNALLKRAGFDMTSVAQKDLNILTAYKQKIVADKILEEINIGEYSFLVIPGGAYVNEVIDDSFWIYNLIDHFHKNNKLIAAICAAPRFLGRSKLLDDKPFTTFPSCEGDMKGTYLKSEKVVTTQNIITGRSVGAIFEFVYEIVLHFYGKEKAEAFYSRTYYK